MRFRGLEIDDQLVLCWSLYRKIAWLLTVEDAIDVRCSLAKLLGDVGAIRHQTASCGKVTVVVNARHLVLSCHSDDKIPVNSGEEVR